MESPTVEALHMIARILAGSALVGAGLAIARPALRPRPDPRPRPEPRPPYPSPGGPPPGPDPGGPPV